MSLGPLMVDIAGLELTPVEREMLCHPQVGGIILFTRNYESPEQLNLLTQSIHVLREPRLLVAVDQEGGRVQRFRDGFTRLPPVALLGTLHDRDAAQARSLAITTGWLMAMELRSMGVDISFAPVLDLDREVCGVIGNRALHRDPECVAELAQAYQHGMAKAGMSATGKHFPGHGGVEEDSHLTLPVDLRSYADIEMEDLVPFIRMVHAGLAAVMSAHVVYPNVDPLPASFSPFWLQEVLRRRLGFQGAIFSDDLSMGATDSLGDYEQRARKALEAGCDMLPVCNAPEEAGRLAEKLEGFDSPASHMRLARLHGRAAPDWQSLRNMEEWGKAVELVHGYDEEPLLDMDL